MSVIFIMAPAALALAAAAIVAFLWAARDGQFDDVDTPPHRVLFDDTPAIRSEDRQESTGRTATCDRSAAHSS